MKMAIVVRNDLDMRKGKIAAQVAHAAASLVFMNPTSPEVLKWMNEEPSQLKVILKAENLAQLNDLALRCKDAGVKFVIIADAGRTQVEPGTITVLGIGPDEDHNINDIVGDLKLL